MNSIDVVSELEVMVSKCNGQREFAKQHGLSAQYVNDVLHGKRKPGPKILKALGLSAKTVYEKV